MYDDDLFSMLNSYTATDTEKETYEDIVSPQNDNLYQPQKSPYFDDYSTSQNYEEEKSYNSLSSENQFDEPEIKQIRQMHTPTVIQQTPAVNLIKKREKIYISARLKIACSIFAIIFASLIFASIWNFALTSRMQASFADKQIQINQMSQSINELRVEYNELSDPEISKDNAINSGYVEKIEGVNSFTFSIDDFYIEPEIEKIPSNWFNDVCEFFSKLFA